MSIMYAILCQRSPVDFLARKARRLRWNPQTQSGRFGTLTLHLRGLEPSDPLPEAGWREKVVAVLHVEGRMSDDDHYDDFVDWSEGLAEDARGAIYQPMGTRQFTYVWPDVSQSETEQEARRRLCADDMAGLVQWIEALRVASSSDKRWPSAPRLQLDWSAAALLDLMRTRVAAGDASVSPVVAALLSEFSERDDPLAAELKAIQKDLESLRR